MLSSPLPLVPAVLLAVTFALVLIATASALESRFARRGIVRRVLAVLAVLAALGLTFTLACLGLIFWPDWLW